MMSVAGRRRYGLASGAFLVTWLTLGGMREGYRGWLRVVGGCGSLTHELWEEGCVFQESLETTLIEGRSSVSSSSSVSMSMMGPCLPSSVDLFYSMAEGDEGWMGWT